MSGARRLGGGSLNALPPKAVLHGCVIRPPRIDDGYAVGLPSLPNAAAVRALAGVAAVVVRDRFVGVIGVSPEVARAAAARLVIGWRDAAAARTMAVARAPSTSVAQPGGHVAATYAWPAEDDACSGRALADVHGDAVTIWTMVATPPRLSAELAQLLGVPVDRIAMLIEPPVDASTINAAVTYHAAADAALLSQAVDRPVMVELSMDELRGDGAIPQIVTTIDATVEPSGAVAAYAVTEFMPREWGSPLARVLTAAHTTPPDEDPDEAVGRDVRLPPLPYPAADISMTRVAGRPRVTALEPAAPAFARVFAVESHSDEAAAAAAIDPVRWRLQRLQDARGAALIERTARHADWLMPRPSAMQPGCLRGGRGFAYASSLDPALGPTARSWSAWVADVQVDTQSGDVVVTRVVVGHDAEVQALAPTSPLDEAGALAALRRLTDERRFEGFSGTPQESTSIEIVGGPDGTPGAARSALTPSVLLGSPTAMLPAAAALANAIFDATGIRLREPPFSATRVRAALEAARAPAAGPRRSWLAGAVGGLAGLIALALPWRAPLAPTAPPSAGFFSSAAIERGRLVAAAGDCAVCHTAPDGARYAGGLALETPFGAVYSTNITPDTATGIGSWSYAAFERAMRQGIDRDGKHLYPAFPYTAYAKMTDGDLLALYAYLMAQPAVNYIPPRTQLAPPFAWRPLLAGWNLLFHRGREWTADPTRSPAWNRGAYLVEGLGHCGACHSPRNALGAERSDAPLAGGHVDGWEAPALTGVSAAPVAWTLNDFYEYLRTGYSSAHGAAAGPMAAVVREMHALPDDDVRAIATYLSALNPAREPLPVSLATPGGASVARLTSSGGLGERIYSGACAMCHEADHGPPAHGVRVELGSTTALHAAAPTNLIRVLLEGVSTPPSAVIGYMPAFHDTLDDAQMTELVGYLRARFAPAEPQWRDIATTVTRQRTRHTATLRAAMPSRP